MGGQGETKREDATSPAVSQTFVPFISMMTVLYVLTFRIDVGISNLKSLQARPERPTSTCSVALLRIVLEYININTYISIYIYIFSPDLDYGVLKRP